MRSGYTHNLLDIYPYMYYIGHPFTLLNAIYFAQRVILNYGGYL
jgi:hypothetical protein